MSMTYPTREPASAIDTQDAVFVPRYARTARSSKKPVKTWMILAPLGAVVVIGGAAAMMMGGEQTSIAPAPVSYTHLRAHET